ncbi:alpha/beta hydrolase [Clostridium sp. MCC353]|uniref:alpha/beta hydrolase n=1 Tax=Clostridium sp. MCC353 TaxID=2592646 RepID=UPI00207A7090|nr:alpha/beta hydrolase [Clostridium sp. MCC353]
MTLASRPFMRDYRIAGLDGNEVVCDIFNNRIGDGKRPALVFVHGGGFVGGDKDQFFAAASWLSMATGALCVTMQYRTAPQHVYPAPVIDCLSVLRWIWDHRESCGICPEWVCLAGGSPGANIGAMAMMAEKWLLKQYGLEPELCFQPRNGIFLNGIYDLEDFYKRNQEEQNHVEAYLNSGYDRDLWRESSPVCRRKEGLNLLLLHGSEDSIVPLQQCEAMKRAAEQEQGRVKIRLFEGRGHAWFNEPGNLYEVLKEIKNYIEEIKEVVN